MKNQDQKPFDKKSSDKQQKQRPDKRDDFDQQPRKPSLWRSIIWIALIWLAITYFYRMYQNPNQVDISYTEFKQQVKKENVKAITIQGDELSGQFVNQYTVRGDTRSDTTSYQYFATTIPSFSDPELIKILEENEVVIKAESEDDSWFPILLLTLLPAVLIIGYFVYMSRRAQGRMKGMMGGGIFGFGKSKAKRYRESGSNITFKDVAGLDNAKRDLKEITHYLKEPEKFAQLGADIPKGVLLIGPPGTGKTMLARAAAGEAGVTFFSISGSEFIEMFVGVGASRVRDMFENAKREAPAIIFIDEIDSIGRARGTGLGGGHDEREQTLNQILSEMDGFEPHQSVVVMAATNRPDVLDPALTRPGRFDRHVTLELPQKEARKKILEIHCKNVPLSKDVDLEVLASRTVGFSGADIKNLVNEAALFAGRRNKKKVDAEDFDQARDKIILGNEREEMMDEEDKKVIAYHEAGHALLAYLLPNTDPLQKVTIIPRGRALGVTEQVSEKDRFNPSRNYLLNRMTIMLGGRSAEKLIFDDLTTGAANDLKRVTQLARKMVCQWGMSQKLGAITFKQGEDHMFLGREIAEPKDHSEHTARIIDEEVQRIVTETEESAFNKLKDNRDKLEALARTLLEKETLDVKEIDEIIEKAGKKNKQKKEKEADPALD